MLNTKISLYIPGVHKITATLARHLSWGLGQKDNFELLLPILYYESFSTRVQHIWTVCFLEESGNFFLSLGNLQELLKSTNQLNLPEKGIWRQRIWYRKDLEHLAIPREKSGQIHLDILLAPTGALIVIVCYYRSKASFWDFKHFCQYT